MCHFLMLHGRLCMGDGQKFVEVLTTGFHGGVGSYNVSFTFAENPVHSLHLQFTRIFVSYPLSVPATNQTALKGN